MKNIFVTYENTTVLKASQNLRISFIVNKEHNNTLLVGSVPVCMALTPANYSSSHTAQSAVQCTIAAVTRHTVQSNAL